MPVRGVESLEALQDATVQKADAEYLSKHGINGMLSATLREVVIAQPDDPLQFMIDSLKSSTVVEVDPVTVARTAKLGAVFDSLDLVRHCACVSLLGP